MGDTSIEWTRNPDGTQGKTWNPIRALNLETGGVGHYCEKISPGCGGCYACRMQPRFKNHIRYNAADRDKVKLFLDEEVLSYPLRWRKATNVFPCSMTDMFGGFVPDEWIDRIFAVMALTPQHTYQVLTKRAERMADYMHEVYAGRMYEIAKDSDAPSPVMHAFADGLRNVWLGVSAENQEAADERLPWLLETTAAVRWLSAEPLLGPVDLSRHIKIKMRDLDAPDEVNIQWVVCGGESGATARPMHPDWARSIRDRCVAAGVPFFFKQWGEWLPVAMPRREFKGERRIMDTAGRQAVATWEDVAGCDEECWAFERAGKKNAGRLLDGREWNEFPA